MSVVNPPLRAGAETKLEKSPTSTLSRVAKYTIVRTITLFITVALGVYLTIIIANMGGYVDEIFKDQISKALMGMAMGMTEVPTEEKNQILAQAEAAMTEAYGLNDPFLWRCAQWLANGLTLNWGDAERLETLEGGSSDVREIVLERLPNTLFVAGTANVLLFFASVYLALSLSEKRGGFFDRLIVSLSPISSAPSWILGVLLIIIFAVELQLLPYGGMFDGIPPDNRIEYMLVVLRHMILPVLAIFFSVFFQSVYTWRAFFLVHTGEDYVDLAKAKGLPATMIHSRYLLRPTLPSIVTSFTLMLFSFWQGAIALEILFYWPGIGELFWMAIKRFDRPVVVGLIVLFAYMLALSVFLLDVIYVWIDPRVEIGGNSQSTRAAARRQRGLAVWGRLKRMRLPKRDKLPRTKVSQIAQTKEAQSSSSTRSFDIRKMVRGLGVTLRQMRDYPMAIVGLLIILTLVGVSIYTVIAIPYGEAIQLWRSREFYRNPRNAAPAWVNLFRKDDLPETIVLDSREGTAQKHSRIVPENMNVVAISFPFEYPYRFFPRELAVIFDAQYDEKQPFVSLTLQTPDRREIKIGDFAVSSSQTYMATQDTRLQRRLTGKSMKEGVIDVPGTMAALFTVPDTDPPVPMMGTYHLRLEGLMFEEAADLDAELVLYGQVHGLAGTDHRRRDLSVALLWGTPVALTIGFLGAIFNAIAAIFIAAVGAWYGGWVDDLIQRLTEVNIILPVLPIGIMVYYAYSKSVWVILGIIVLMSIFSIALKNYRALFLQIKQAPYIEAARAYGASNSRIILRYLIPRVMLILIPEIVILIPTYVFLESTLAFLGITDPSLPTWGKVIFDAISNGAFRGYYYWVLEPIGIVLLTGLAFAMVGYALDNIFNPRLRDI